MERFYRKNSIYAFLVVALFIAGCDSEGEKTSTTNYDTLNVMATAYNSTEAQTKKGSVGVAAWGDTLKPGMKAIAISRDLLDSGLSHNTRVKIEGLEGTFLVKDKMNKRWTNKIDIYMGLNEEKARNWGKQEVAIYIPEEGMEE
ncbi:lipoprotein [Marivirga lumbricoides]|uniref:Lipoprotein n=1 Tax=Marivirga lumbricoides TaxID=1046115 RepID=A0ABQ1MII2_9BACT|nr:lipoprotein [Marivirga lumbricoides]